MFAVREPMIYSPQRIRNATENSCIGENTNINELSDEQVLNGINEYAKQIKFEPLDNALFCTINGKTGSFLGNLISPTTNKRNDRWGGNLENRMRASYHIVNRVRELIKNDLVIEFHISGAEYIKDGYTVEEGIRIAKALEDKVDIIYVSAGIDLRKDGFVKRMSDMGIEHGCNLKLASEIKKHISIPVATTGGLGDARMMNAIIASGKVDYLYSV